MERSQPVAEDEARRLLQQELLEKSVEKQLDGLDPGHTQRQPKHWQRVLSGFVLLLIAGIVVWGVLGRMGRVPTGIWTVVRANNNGLSIKSVSQRYVVLMVSQYDRNEVRLLDQSTGQWLDVSQGEINVSQAALSPDESTIAYAVTMNHGSALRLRSTISGTKDAVISFDAAALLASANTAFGWPTVAICPWSDLYWAPQGNLIAFFGCQKTATAAFVVPAQAGASPRAIANSEAQNDTPRTAWWLPDGRFIFTSGGEPSDALLAFDPINQTQQRLYGPLK